MTDTQASGAVLLTHPVGLHARPSVKLTKLAKTFRSTIEISTGGENTMPKKPGSLARTTGTSISTFAGLPERIVAIMLTSRMIQPER